MTTPRELHDEVFMQFVEEIRQLDLSPEATLSAMKALEAYSKSRPDEDPTPEPPPYVPTTRWEKFKAGAAAVLDNETTRVAIKAGGSLAGVLAVIFATTHKDHVLERQAMNQANQRNS